MSDLEMLELAAKAAGYRWRGFSAFGEPLLEEDVRKPEPRPRCPVVWNPLTDDGDALRLAVKLGISIQHSATIDTQEPSVETFDSENRFGGWFDEVKGSDPYAATRRAIVRAAAEIGWQMQEGGAA